MHCKIFTYAAPSLGILAEFLMTSEPSLITAIVPNYNYAAFLRSAIESLLAQDVPFREVIVVDDGSTDNSREILNSYAELVTIVTKENGGQLGACLTGLARAQSPFVYFMDADDKAYPNLVRRVQPMLQNDVVQAKFALEAMDENGRPKGTAFPSYRNNYSNTQMQADNNTLGFHISAPTSGLIFSVSALRSLPLDRLFARDFIDGVPNLLMPYLGKVLTLNEPLAWYRVHGASHSQWGKPTQALLTVETQMHTRRWGEAAKILEGISCPKSDVKIERSSFMTERAIMMRVLEGRRVRPIDAIRFARAVVASHMTPRLKAFNVGWAAALLLAPAALARKILEAKRSTAKRPAILERLLRLGR